MEGEAKVNELLKKDISIRVLAILFALLLWFYVLNDANPMQSKEIPVDLKVMNENALQEKGLILVNKDLQKSVRVAVTGRKDNVMDINENDFDVKVDFSQIKDSGTKELPITVTPFSKDITIEGVSPQTIRVDVEKIINKQFAIKATTKGSL